MSWSTFHASGDRGGLGFQEVCDESEPDDFISAAKWRSGELIVRGVFMVDYSSPQISASRYLTDNLAKAGNAPRNALISGPIKAPTNALSFDPNIPVDTSAVEQMKGLLLNGNVRLLRSFLIGRFDELRDLARFNMMLLSAGPPVAEHSVNMDVILRGINEFPVIRLNDSKGDFCVVRFDRQPKR